MNVTLCLSTSCENREHCLRYRAFPHIGQRYRDFKAAGGDNFIAIHPVDESVSLAPVDMVDKAHEEVPLADYMTGKEHQPETLTQQA